MSDGTWAVTNGGDATGVVGDPVTDDYLYSSYINGITYRSSDYWASGNTQTISQNIPGQASGDWVTPYLLDPNNTAPLLPVTMMYTDPLTEETPGQK